MSGLAAIECEPRLRTFAGGEAVGAITAISFLLLVASPVSASALAALVRTAGTADSRTSEA
jgi:hypothetical protein